MTEPVMPAALTVGGRVYEVRRDADTSKRVRDSGYRGQTFTEHLLIEMDGTMPLTLKQETLLHEVMHCAWDVVGLGKTIGSEDEEKAIKSLAPVILQVLRQNRALIPFLLADDGNTRGKRWKA